MSDAVGRLLVCATPIGNLGDVTLRVLDALRDADLIAAEDTRVTRRLLARYEIGTPLERCDEHSVGRIAPLLIQRVLSGATIAFVSDAGTPGVSDPGARLIGEALRSGAVVETLPGASALLAALVASGMPMQHFYFGGFLSRKAGERRRELEALAGLDATLVFFESPRRAAATLSMIAEVFPERDGALARELTKLHEEVVRAPMADLAEQIAQRIQLKGEVVLLVSPPVAAPRPSVEDPGVSQRANARINELLGEGLSRSAAVKQAAGELGVPKSQLYASVHSKK